MTTLVQMNYDDLQQAFKNCLREAINEFKELPLQPELPDNMGIDEAVIFLNQNGTPYKKSQIYKGTSNGSIPVRKFGKKLVFSRKQLRAWLDKQTVQKVTSSQIMAQHLAREANKKCS
jgi:hypothetical protein